MTALYYDVTASGSGAGATAMGPPTLMRIGTLVRPRRLGWPLVHTRCEPQMTTGRIGTPASTAIPAAPVLNSLSSNDREVVASGKTPTFPPARSAPTAAAYEAAPAVRSTVMWC